MPRFGTCTLLLLHLSVVTGCDCGGESTPVLDAGDDAQVDAGPGFSTIRLRFLDASSGTDVPVQDVRLAVDTSRERLETSSGPEGTIDVVVPAEEMQLDLTWATPGFAVESRLGVHPRDLGDGGEAERVDVYLIPVVDEPGIVSVSVDATGLSSDQRWCGSVGAWIARCVAGDESIDLPIAADDVQDEVSGYAFDATGDIVELATATLTDAGASRAATLVFDGVSEIAPSSRTITVELPADSESPFRETGLIEGYPGIVRAVQSGTYLTRGGVSHVERAGDGTSYSMTLTVFADTGESLVYAMEPYASFDGPVRAARWFSGDVPSGALSFLDVPRIESGGPGLDSTFSWTAPDGAESYRVALINADQRVVQIFSTESSTDVRIPPLPSTYDPEVSYPIPGAPGRLQVSAIAGNSPPNATLAEPWAVDAEASWGATRDITF